MKKYTTISMFIFGLIAIPITMFALVSYAKNVPFTKGSQQNAEQITSGLNGDTTSQTSDVVTTGSNEAPATESTDTASQSQPETVPVVQTPNPAPVQTPAVQTSQVTAPKPAPVTNPIKPFVPSGDDEDDFDD